MKRKTDKPRTPRRKRSQPPWEIYVPPANDNPRVAAGELEALQEKLVEMQGELDEAERSAEFVEEARAQLEESRDELDMAERLLEAVGLSRRVLDYAVESDDPEQALRALGLEPAR